MGEFNGDGFDDLVIGTIGEDLNLSAYPVTFSKHASESPKRMPN